MFYSGKEVKRQKTLDACTQLLLKWMESFALETRPDSPGEPGMQPRDPCLPWSWRLVGLSSALAFPLDLGARPLCIHLTLSFLPYIHIAILYICNSFPALQTSQGRVSTTELRQTGPHNPCR